MLRQLASNIRANTAMFASTSSSYSSSSSSSYFYALNSTSLLLSSSSSSASSAVVVRNEGISTASRTSLFPAMMEKQHHQQQQQQQQRGIQNQNQNQNREDRYGKSSGPVAKLLHLIYTHQPIDSQRLYQLAVENRVEVHSRRHMKTLLQQIKSRKQFRNNDEDKKNKNARGQKKRIDGFIKAERPFDASGKMTKVTYTFSVEEKGRKHLEKLGLIEAQAEEDLGGN
jgi:hypothetical protein